ncbi:type I restriction-modification system subunit M [Pontibacter pudoricolor]|uniref:type I restriction-modification system subunit M n=1 Tax=Pontibacter pudoricolor TaxID=2694930 RepID=UPI001391F129|nr:class I SAM-dependent DNA methyltransferase [Pontibacter pudoricolor]
MSSLQSKIDRITDILRRDDGISGAMHYTEQISWILFLKFLSDFEENKYTEAELEGRTYEYVIDQEHRWYVWACPKDQDGKLDVKKALTGDDLTNYVNTQLFPYLQGFKTNTADLRSIRYKIGAIFEYLDNRIASGHTLREVLDIIDSLNFQSQTELFELSHIYENLLKGMGSDGGNSGEYYTPRTVVQAMVQVVDPQIGDTIYDGAAGSCGFLVEAYEYMTSPEKRAKLSTNDWRILQSDTFYGNEKTPLAYVMGVMNMILHGVDSPNIYKQNTLTLNIRDIQEKDRYSVILANPPFGGKEKSQVQQNFPVQSNATELLFLQHFMKSLKVGGKAAIIVPEGVLYQTNNAFKGVKQELLENFNLHTIVSLPSGIFLPYSNVKTNIIFFERTGATTDIWYYEVNPPYKLTKNKPIATEHMKEFAELYSTRVTSENSWLVNVADIVDYDLSAKNPTKQQSIEHLPPIDIVAKLNANDKLIGELLNEIESILIEGYAGE